MVLNPTTLHVSPQYHVVFDDNFSTVSSMASGEIPDNWLDLVKLSEEHRDEAGNDLTKLWASAEFNPFHDEEVIDDPTPTNFDTTSTKSNTAPVNELLMPIMPDLDELTCRRSKREKRTPERFDPSATTTINGGKDGSSYKTSIMFSMICLVTIGSMPLPPQCTSIYSKFVYHTHLINEHFDGTLNYINPMAYAADLSDNETYTFKQMLQQEYKNDFILAMMKEIQDHEKRNHWHLFPRANITNGHKTILAI